MLRAIFHLHSPIASWLTLGPAYPIFFLLSKLTSAKYHSQRLSLGCQWLVVESARVGALRHLPRNSSGPSHGWFNFLGVDLIVGDDLLDDRALCALHPFCAGFIVKFGLGVFPSSVLWKFALLGGATSTIAGSGWWLSSRMLEPMFYG